MTSPEHGDPAFAPNRCESAGKRTAAHVIHVVAALLVDEDGRALMVRKRATTRFMQPGGKPETGETGAQALARELAEELGLVIPPSEFTFISQFVTAAANEEDTVLYADVFDAPVVTARVEARAEIEELLWVDPANPGSIALAPLSSEELLPMLAARLARPLRDTDRPRPAP